MKTPRSRHRPASTLLAIAQVGHAQLFFGDLYEAVVKVPHRFSEHRDLAVTDDEPTKTRLMLRPGNPTLYFLPTGIITVAASLSALAVGWNSPLDRRWLAASSAATVAMAVETTYVVREVNSPLFFTALPPNARERSLLLRRWYRLNAIRIVVTGIAWFSAANARRLQH